MKPSAGILLFKKSPLQVLLVHPGGPFWKNKDLGSWSVPKGESEAGENPLDAAIREFREETGNAIDGEFIALQPVRLKSGKIVHCWTLEGQIDAGSIVSSTFEIQWPPKSGKIQIFPEVDKAGWFPIDEALERINEAQQSFLRELVRLIAAQNP